MRYLTLLLLVISLSSCGLFKKVVRNVDKESSKTKVEVVSEQVGQVVDKSTTVVTEKKDTVITTPSKQSQSVQLVNLDSLIDAITHVKNDLVDISFRYDKLSGVLTTNVKVKPQEVPVFFERTITTQNDVTTNTSAKSATKSESQSKSKVTNKESTPTYGWIWIVLVVVGVIGFVFWIRNKTRIL